jgi:ATP-dependent Clp protease adaptor protein ClpS
MRARRVTVENDCVPMPVATPERVVEVGERAGEEADDARDEDRPWVVIVWNDPVNLMSYVTYVFQKLFGYSLEKAYSLMLDVHEKGRATVSSGSRDEMERDATRLHAYGLWATLSKD